MTSADYKALMFDAANEPLALKLAENMGLRVWKCRGHCVGVASGNAVPRIVAIRSSGMVDFERSSALVGDHLADGGKVVWVSRRREKTVDGMLIHAYVLIATNP